MTATNLLSNKRPVLFLGICLSILLIQDPTGIYLMFHNAYKVIYALCIFVLLIVYLYRQSRGYDAGIFNTPGASNYLLFLFLSTIILLIDAMANGKVDLMLSVQFLMKIAQFYVILYLVFRLGAKEKLIDIFYGIAVILSFLSIVMVFFNAIGWFPFPRIDVNYLASANGTIPFYFPFGFYPGAPPVDPMHYRSYSYFTEPANFGFFIMPYMYYSAFKLISTKAKKHLFFFGIIALAVIFTQSTAAFISFFAALFIIAIFNLLISRRKIKLLLWLTLSVIILSFIAAAFVEVVVYGKIQKYQQNAVLFKRAITLEDRYIQFETSLKYISSHVLGEGIGYSYVIPVRLKSTGKISPYSEPTSILTSVYYLGMIYIIPLLILLGYVVKKIFDGMRSQAAFLKALSYMMLAMLIYNLSTESFFTAYSLTILSVFYLALRQYQYNQSPEPGTS